MTCRNHQLTHPLISTVNGYLGGLCPLFVMASDKEVIRDEIIYMYVLARSLLELNHRLSALSSLVRIRLPTPQNTLSKKVSRIYTQRIKASRRDMVLQMSISKYTTRRATSSPFSPLLHLPSTRTELWQRSASSSQRHRPFDHRALPHPHLALARTPRLSHLS